MIPRKILTTLFALSILASVVYAIWRINNYERFKSYLGKNQDEFGRPLTRGYRNNNPANIKRNAANEWTGRVDFEDSTDTVFEQFQTLAYGTRALIKVLQRYMSTGSNTLIFIATRFAPPIENDTKNYVDSLASISGLSRVMPLSADKDTLRVLAQSITRIESGRSITLAEFEAGWKLL